MVIKNTCDRIITECYVVKVKVSYFCLYYLVFHEIKTCMSSVSDFVRRE